MSKASVCVCPSVSLVEVKTFCCIFNRIVPPFKWEIHLTKLIQDKNVQTENFRRRIGVEFLKTLECFPVRMLSQLVKSSLGILVSFFIQLDCLMHISIAWTFKIMFRGRATWELSCLKLGVSNIQILSSKILSYWVVLRIYLTQEKALTLILKLSIYHWIEM